MKFKGFKQSCILYYELYAQARGHWATVTGKNACATHIYTVTKNMYNTRHHIQILFFIIHRWQADKYGDICQYTCVTWGTADHQLIDSCWLLSDPITIPYPRAVPADDQRYRYAFFPGVKQVCYSIAFTSPFASDSTTQNFPQDNHWKPTPPFKF